MPLFTKSFTHLLDFSCVTGHVPVRDTWLIYILLEHKLQFWGSRLQFTPFTSAATGIMYLAPPRCLFITTLFAKYIAKRVLCKWIDQRYSCMWNAPRHTVSDTVVVHCAKGYSYASAGPEMELLLKELRPFRYSSSLWSFATTSDGWNDHSITYTYDIWLGISSGISIKAAHSTRRNVLRREISEKKNYSRTFALLPQRLATNFPIH